MYLITVQRITLSMESRDLYPYLQKNAPLVIRAWCQWVFVAHRRSSMVGACRPFTCWLLSEVVMAGACVCHPSVFKGSGCGGRSSPIVNRGRCWLWVSITHCRWPCHMGDMGTVASCLSLCSENKGLVKGGNDGHGVVGHSPFWGCFPSPAPMPSRLLCCPGCAVDPGLQTRR